MMGGSDPSFSFVWRLFAWLHPFRDDPVDPICQSDCRSAGAPREVVITIPCLRRQLVTIRRRREQAHTDATTR